MDGFDEETDRQMFFFSLTLQARPHLLLLLNFQYCPQMGVSNQVRWQSSIVRSRPQSLLWRLSSRNNVGKKRNFKS